MVVLTWANIQRIMAHSETTPSFFTGTAVSIGSFDGPHIGHDVLFNAVTDYCKTSSAFPGIVTFAQPLGGMKNPSVYKGDISTMAQRLEIFEKKGFAFVIVIDFSADFGRMEGQQFLSILKDCCGMKFMAEGKDFRCGYKGAFGRVQIERFALENGICVAFPEPVMYKSSRVSSSLIRESVLSADFSSAAYMLGRPYTLDFSNTGDAFKRRMPQVLPPDGTYDVCAITPGESIRTQLLVEPNNLRLGVPPEKACRVRAVEFL